MNYRSILVLILLPLTLFSPVSAARAEEIVVTVEGNGSNSSNEVNVQSSSETNVTQNNSAEINNNVEANANTGNNEASHNSGETNIETGDAQVSTNIANQNINNNSATNPPCACDNQNTNISVSGNGGGSTNAVNTNVSGGSFTTQNNTANINNSVVTNANTGRNSAQVNNGNIKIKTGSIYAETKIVNEDININRAEDKDLLFKGLSIKVDGNGAGSTNIVSVRDTREAVYSALNTANIYNSDVKNLNTGENKADFNLGEVWIGTGDIVAVTEIINRGINVNDYTKTCDCEKAGGEVTPPPPVTPPSKPPHHNGESRDNGNGGVGGNGDVMGAANGEILPVTGQLAYFFLTLSAIILFLAGWYLRFRSGVAPGIEVVV